MLFNACLQIELISFQTCCNATTILGHMLITSGLDIVDQAMSFPDLTIHPQAYLCHSTIITFVLFQNDADLSMYPCMYTFNKKLFISKSIIVLKTLNQRLQSQCIYSLYILCGSIYLVHYKQCSDTNLSHPQSKDRGNVRG